MYYFEFLNFGYRTNSFHIILNLVFNFSCMQIELMLYLV